MSRNCPIGYWNYYSNILEGGEWYLKIDNHIFINLGAGQIGTNRNENTSGSKDDDIAFNFDI